MSSKKTKQHEKIAQYSRGNIFALAFGAMIGWAWVIQSGTWIDTAGTLGAVLAFIVGGVIVVFVGQVYAELTAAINCRGVIAFTLRGGGRTLAFIATWSLVLGYLAVCAFESVALPNVITYLFPNYKQVYLYSISGFDIYFYLADCRNRQLFRHVSCELHWH